MPHVMVETRVCLYCGKSSFIEMPQEAYDKWQSGMLIQSAWPDASPATREQLISGTHGACWDKLIGTEED